MNEKFDRLDALILLAGDVLIEEELAYAREVLNPDIEISKRTDRRILRYIRHAQKKPGYHPALDAMKRAAMVVLVIGTVLFASAMSIEAVREKFWNAIVEWYEDYIAVMFVNDEESDTMADAEFEVREPSYLPEGVTKGEQIVSRVRCSTTYSNSEISILLEQFIKPDNDIKIDNNNCVLTDIVILNYKGVLAEYTNGQMQTMLIWEDKLYRYKLIAKTNCDFKEEILKMAYSIYD